MTTPEHVSVLSVSILDGKSGLVPGLVPGFQGWKCPGTLGMEEALAPGPNFNRPVKDLVHKDLLASTFTQASHDRGIKTWRASVSYPQCVFCGNKFRYESFNVECHMDPNIGKATIGKERTVAACKESLPTSRGPHRNRFLEVQAKTHSSIVFR